MKEDLIPKLKRLSETTGLAETTICGVLLKDSRMYKKILDGRITIRRAEKLSTALDDPDILERLNRNT